MPKIMHKIARTGLEMVIPIFFNPFSTTSVILCSSSNTYYSYIDNQLIFKTFEKPHRQWQFLNV
jgi:hypothetical protein